MQNDAFNVPTELCNETIIKLMLIFSSVDRATNFVIERNNPEPLYADILHPSWSKSQESRCPYLPFMRVRDKSG